MSAKTKYLIIGTGRCGTSLLSAILSDAGANFGMDNPEGWRRVAGAYEHDDVQQACIAFKTARKFAAISDMWWGFRKLRRLHMHRAKTALKRLFSKADYAKSMDLGRLVHTVFKLDHTPRIILIYRNFENVAMSSYLAFGWSHAETEAHYLETYRTGLTALHVFGGCVIGYDEIMDPSESAWAESLSEATGLPRDKLLSARNSRLKPIDRKHTLPPPLGGGKPAL